MIFSYVRERSTQLSTQSRLFLAAQNCMTEVVESKKCLKLHDIDWD